MLGWLKLVLLARNLILNFDAASSYKYMNVYKARIGVVYLICERHIITNSRKILLQIEPIDNQIECVNVFDV